MDYRRFQKALEYMQPTSKPSSLSEPNDLELLTNRPSLLRTLLLIYEYLVVKRRKGFTYRGLRAYWDSKGLYKDKRDPAHEWHTVERNVRELATLGFLERRHPSNNKKQVIFIPTKRFWNVIEERRGLLDDG